MPPRAYVPDANDVVWLEFDPQAGHEQAGHRPALVISPAIYNGRSGLMVCCPISTKIKGYPFEVTTEIDGIECMTPDGSFYVFPDIRGTGMTAQQFADYLVEEHQVGVVAGNAFGDRGEGHIRFTYPAPDDILEEGMERIAKAVEAL